MPPLTRPIVSCCAVACMAVTALATQARAQANCDMYGKLALQQQQLNEDVGCGFKGAAWNSDLQRHIEWCDGVPPDQWKVELQKRQKALDACKAKKGD